MTAKYKVLQSARGQFYVFESYYAPDAQKRMQLVWRPALGGGEHPSLYSAEVAIAQATQPRPAPVEVFYDDKGRQVSPSHVGRKALEIVVGLFAFAALVLGAVQLFDGAIALLKWALR